jgi:flagellar biosynthesis/type III secretory pathway protein FliH
MQYITSVERMGIEQGLQRGMQQGIQQGVQQGMQQGQAEMVLRALTRRFGDTPSPLAARIRALPSAQLPALLDVALTAASLAEVVIALEALSMNARNALPLPA